MSGSQNGPLLVHTTFGDLLRSLDRGVDLSTVYIEIIIIFQVLRMVHCWSIQLYNLCLPILRSLDGGVDLCIFY
jgi:hypothetical protein